MIGGKDYEHQHVGFLKDYQRELKFLQLKQIMERYHFVHLLIFLIIVIDCLITFCVMDVHFEL